jgi:hypothetical protein
LLGQQEFVSNKYDLVSRVILRSIKLNFFHKPKKKFS